MKSVWMALALACTSTAVVAQPDTPPPRNATPAPGPAATPPSDAARAETPGPNPVLTKINSAGLDDHGVRDGVDPAVLRAEVMLDRAHISPGVIDGRRGGNFEHALKTYQTQQDLKVSGALDKATWDSLVEKAGDRPVLVEHVLSDKDVAGPFFPDLPKDYAELAKLKTIGYRTIAQKLGAQFHLGEDLLAELNPGVDFSKAGGKIVVPDTAGKPVIGKISKILVDKQDRQVLGLDGKGRVLIALPATIGSRELPSPSGTYKIRGVAYDPVYYYDPKNFLQGENHDKLQLPPGPNNPVGSVFIALTKPTYGLHGTPDPSKIDKTASHGCVRMTNWDADELAHLVRRGITVSFVKVRKS